MRALRFAVLALIALAASAARADDAAMPMHAHGAADAALMKSMDVMNKAMVEPMTGDPDKDFVAMMIPHHEAAVAMAKVQLQYGKDPKLRAMAKDIIDSQGREIATMKAWQAAHGR